MMFSVAELFRAMGVQAHPVGERNAPRRPARFAAFVVDELAQQIISGAVAEDDVLPNEPALWRSNTGRYTTAGATPAEPGMPGFNAAAPGPRQLVARGSE